MKPCLTSSHTLWASLRTLMQAMSSATVYTTGEKAALSGIYNMSLTAAGVFITRNQQTYIYGMFIKGLNRVSV